jgi:ferredoxin-fold anticodon binding domain-containing protein
MGLSNGKSLKGNDKKIKKISKLFNPEDPVPEVTLNDVKILKEMWAIVKDDISKVGVITFVR